MTQAKDKLWVVMEVAQARTPMLMANLGDLAQPGTNNTQQMVAMRPVKETMEVVV